MDRGESGRPACARCGTPPSPGQSFCDSCGEVLGWTPEPGPRPGPAAAQGGQTPPRGAAVTDPANSAEPGHGAKSGHGAEPAYSAEATHGAEPARAAEATRGTQPARAAEPVFDIAAACSGRAAARRQNGPPPAEPALSAVPFPAPAGSGPRAGHPGTPPDAAHRDNASTVRTPAATPDGAPGAAPGAAPLAGPGSGPGSGPGDPAAAPPAADASELLAAERARALLIPVAEPQAVAAPSVAPVQPGRPITARPQVQGPRGQGDDGGTPCPWCGTGNRPDRHFCRRCALTMAGRPQDAARRPWWRRLPGLGDRQPPWAGERPRLRGGLGRVLSWVAGAAALVLVVVAALHTGSAVQAVRDHFAKRAPISADSSKASHSYPGHGPGLAFDKLNNTWWGPGVTQSGAGEWIEADFARPTRLLDVVITSGESTQPADLAKSALPYRIEAVATTADGKKHSRFLTLDGASGGQTRAFRVGDVTAVRFILRSAYGATADKQVAIAEVEFFGPSSGNGS
ncbi:zinc ribbon domain-containing protein [Streptomyces sp. NBC_01190]|nr:zinc ribbon domain-containing protein [Streptomyces sp. NBC_01190]